MLTRKEFREGLTSLQLGLSRAQIEVLVDRLDFDGSGDISYFEFLSKFGEACIPLLRHAYSF